MSIKPLAALGVAAGLNDQVAEMWLAVNNTLYFLCHGYLPSDIPPWESGLPVNRNEDHIIRSEN